MALVGYPKTSLSPKIIVHNGIGALAEVSGEFDLVKVVSTDATHYSTITFRVAGDDTERTIQVLAGDVVEGPFTTIQIDSQSNAAVDAMIYQRDSLTTD